jgi:hypothetical protein
MLILAIVAGCAPAFRAHPQLEEKVKSIKTVATVPPRIKVYQLLFVDGDAQLMDDPTAAATQNVAIAIEKELSHHSSFVFKPFPAPSAILDTSSDPTAASVQEELEDTQALFEAVSASVLLHTYGPGGGGPTDQTFPEKVKNFDYSLGPDVQRLAKFANADAFLFISGVDRVPIMGQVVGSVVGTFLLMAVTAPLGGCPGCGIPVGSSTILSVALVDARTGALLWHNVFSRREIWGHYLANPQRAADMVERVFKGFPESGRPTRNQ